MRKNTIKLRQIVTAFLLLGSSFLMAQEAKLSGYIVQDNKPIANATVTVQGTSLVTTTDVNGFYTFELKPGNYEVKATIIGQDPILEQVSLFEEQEQNIDFDFTSLNLNEVVLIGSRGKARSIMDAVAPIDVIDISQVTKEVGQVSLNQILNYVVPSFSSNTQVISDGTDHIDPASLRGLGPDQVLVLINGKRRHTTSLINVNGTFGKGSVGTDLNAIPTSAIKRIEILRDGASAQYGSDAIAGVINIVLEDATDQVKATISYGGNLSKNAKDHFDGEQVQANLNYGVKVGDKGGFVNLSASFDQRAAFNRQKTFTGTIFSDYNRPDLYPNPTGLDITEAELIRRGETREDYISRVGQAKIKGGALFLNSVLPVNKKTEIYTFGGLNYRQGESAAFRRQPSQLHQTVSSIFPNGYLPLIGTNNYDHSLAMGIRSEVSNWAIDFSNTYGSNRLDFTAKNTVNASMQDASPTSFKAGGYRFTQNTTNIDFSRYFDTVLHGINVAFGGEYRYENYQIEEGEKASYTNYGKARQVGVDANGNPILIPDSNGNINTLFASNGQALGGGAQAFPGFLPENAIDASRNSFAAYIDTELNISPEWMVTAAARFENFSDFGSTINGKIATRYKVGNLVFRAAASTGFRAPSLHQSNFSATSSLFLDGAIQNSGTFTNTSRVAQLLGIPQLKEEKSKNISAGFTANMGKFKLTVDGYFIRIDDRIVYTGYFTGSNSSNSSAQDKEIYSLLQQANATSARFFANAIDTETKGIDLVLTYQERLGNGKFRADLAATINQTTVVGKVHASPTLIGKEATYFDRSSRMFLESAVPRTKLNLSMNYSLNQWSFYVRNVYFGEVDGATNNIESDQVFSAKVITDATVSYQLTKNLGVSIGANNVFDIYPDKTNPGSLQGAGYFPYSRTGQQFGMGGRFAFARLAVNL